MPKKNWNWTRIKNTFLTGGTPKGIGNTDADKTFWNSIRVNSRRGAPSVKDPMAVNPWVASAIRKISGNVASVPFYQKEKDKTEWAKNQEFIKVLKRPNNFMTGNDLMRATSTWLDLFGECFWYLVRDNSLVLPERILVMDSTRMTEIMGGGGQSITGWEYELKSGKKEYFALHEILHFKYFNYKNPCRGLAPWRASKLAIDQDFMATQFNISYFQNSSVLSGAVSVANSTKEQRGEIREEIETNYTGAGKAHKLLVLSGDSDFKAFPFSIKDMSFGELKNKSREEVLIAFDINPVVMGIFEDVKSYEGSKHAYRQFWLDAILPRLGLIKDTINAGILEDVEGGRYVIETDLSEIYALKEDYGNKLDNAKRLKDLGYTLNQVNEQMGLGMDDVKWGDTPPNEPGLIDTDDQGNGGADDEKAKALRAAASKNTVYPVKYGYKKKILSRVIPKMDASERKFSSKFRKVLMELRAEVLSRIGDEKNYKSAVAKGLFDDLFNNADFEARLGKEWSPLYIDSFIEGAKTIVEEIGTGDINYQLVNGQAIQFSETRITGIPKKIFDTIQDILRAHLTEGIGQGESITELAKRVRSLFNRFAKNSITIARTESATAINNGRFAEMQNKGIARHTWLSAGDNHVRALHDIDGETVDVGARFSNGLKYPNDPAGSAGNVINCRCIAIAALNEAFDGEGIVFDIN